MGLVKTISKNQRVKIYDIIKNKRGQIALTRPQLEKRIINSLGKDNIKRIASLLSGGQTQSLLKKVSSPLRKAVLSNIRAGLVLIPTISASGTGGSSSITGIVRDYGGTPSQFSKLGKITLTVPRHTDYFKPEVTKIVNNVIQGYTPALKSATTTAQAQAIQQKIINKVVPRATTKYNLTPRQASILRAELKTYLRNPPRMTPHPRIGGGRFGFPLYSKGKRRFGTLKGSNKLAYAVYGLSGGKWLKLTKKPLLKVDALARGSYAIDRTTAKTFKIVPVGYIKKLGNLVKREKGYYTKTGYKFREYRVKKGKKYTLVLKQIEKKKYGIDTRGEIAGLSLAKYLKKLKGGKY